MNSYAHVIAQQTVAEWKTRYEQVVRLYLEQPTRDNFNLVCELRRSYMDAAAMETEVAYLTGVVAHPR